MKIYVIAGNTQEFLHYRADKFNSLKGTKHEININDFVNVSSCNVLRGVANPHGVFIGTWRKRLDITEVLNTLSVCSHVRNPALDNLRSEIVPPIKPTPKLIKTTNPPPYDTGIDAAAAAMAKAIDDEVLRNLIGKPANKDTLDVVKQLLGGRAVFDSATSTVTVDKWFDSFINEYGDDTKYSNGEDIL